jgi:alkylation response protein AidB-like acyl-CoA dehydrogenase
MLTSHDQRRSLLIGKTAGQRPRSAIHVRASILLEEIYTIFEGTSEIQRLVIARAISGMRIR